MSRRGEYRGRRNGSSWSRGRGRPSTNQETTQNNDHQNTDNFRGNHASRGRGSYSGRGRGRTDEKRKWKYFGFKRLTELCGANILDVINELSNRPTDFEELLREPLNPDWMMMVLKILSRICTESEFQARNSSLLSIAYSKEFFNQLRLLLLESVSKMNKKDFQTVLGHMLDFSEQILMRMPKNASDGKLENLLMAMKMVMKEISVEGELMDRASDLKEKLELIVMKEDEAETKAKGRSLREQEEPPDNFREISVYPTAMDMVKMNFIRPNLINGAYGDINHYLDVQFRLLREDFITPLREGLNTFKSNLESGTKKRNPSLRIYNNIYFVHDVPKKQRDVLSYAVQFWDPKRKQNIDWKYSKRLIFGSLLLFSTDEFRTFFLATVSDRDLKDLEQGIIYVSPIAALPDQIFDRKFLMAESKVFFKPYYEVLRGLQNISNLPLERYILSIDCSESFPSYILKNPGASYNFRGEAHDLFLEENLISFKDCAIVADEAGWPSATDLGFNTSQYIAFRAALRSEFSVIQGPPGTGKTFLALKLAKTLNLNRSHFGFSPILVVCYTNHALDQFLEGILEFSENILRIGGGSKNEALEKYSLQNVKRSNSFWTRSSVAYRVALKCMRECNENYLVLKKVLKSMEDTKAIISLDLLKYVMHEKQKEQIKKSSDLVTWLTGVYVSMQGKTITDEDKSHKDNTEEENDVDEEEEFRQQLFGDVTADLQVTINYERVFAADQEGLADEIKDIETHIMEVKGQALNPSSIWYIIEAKDKKHRAEELQQKISCSFTNVPSPRPEIMKPETSLWSLSERDRWSLYLAWIKKLKPILNEKLFELIEQITAKTRELEEIQEMELVSFIESSRFNFVGLTTTGSARYRRMLRAVKPKIIIVEEAAEVLEAHVITALSESIEHIILIGDHQQLSPSPATFLLAKKYNLNISFFERMIMSGLECLTLDVQHRMRAEIASLVSPTIYPNLQNYPSVLTYPDVVGVKHNLFFVSHTEPEEQVSDIDSHQNMHEGTFLLALCKYLLLQGYARTDITILTTYSGQLFLLKKLSRGNALFKGVRMTCVDNFQGEENKIILLSLVRSNSDNKIGFLGTPNRICVALSRAKEGLYIIGNMDNLTASSELWVKIKKTLEDYGSLGPQMTLKCQIHQTLTEVGKASDFHTVAEGGCSRLCDLRLSCGHICRRLCHVTDQAHEEYKCMEPCVRSCIDGHVCPVKCFVNCPPCSIIMTRDLDCGHTAEVQCHVEISEIKCQQPVEVTKGDCGHTSSKKCYIKPEHFVCPQPCDIRLPCGHSCSKRCHITNDPDHMEYKCWKDCAKSCNEGHNCTKRCHEECGDCTVVINKRPLLCGHFQNLACSTDLTKFFCKKPCKKILPCSHNCKKRCGDACGDCMEKVEKTIEECGHKVKTECYRTVTRNECKSKCTMTLPCGHPCRLNCRRPCTDKICTEMVKISQKSPCGHDAYVECWKTEMIDFEAVEMELLTNCREPCSQILPCEDVCQGTCGECFQGRLHVPCSSSCKNTLICGHSCPWPCRNQCPPCTAKCFIRCSHNKCNKPCGDPCTRCKEPCEWKCEHMSCRLQCGQLCTREECNEPCRKTLKCGHPCVGLCGEQCPPLCRVCHKDQLTEILFGTEDEEDARFILLEDCKHVLEVTGCDQFIGHFVTENDNRAIKFPCCPKCTTPIQRSLRYGNIVKQISKSVQNVKRKIYGPRKEFESKISSLRELVDEAKSELSRLASKKFPLELSDISIYILKLLPPKKARENKFFVGLSHLNATIFSLYSLQAVLAVVLKMETFDRIHELKSGQSLLAHFKVLTRHLCLVGNKVSEIEQKQIPLEVNRFCDIVNYFVIESSEACQLRLHMMEVVELKRKADTVLYSTAKYGPTSQEGFQRIVKGFEEALKARLGLSAEEKRQIMSAMEREFHSSYKAGHWYECPNGHPYCITECGGAMQLSSCPECKAPIGGGNHALTRGNRVASEFSGANQPAWPQ